MSRARGHVGRGPRRYGPAVGEPPPLVDPRRWGSLVGLAGGVVFVANYSSALEPVVQPVAWVLAPAGVVTALVGHYVRPVALGPLTRPGPPALLAYLACVAGELALIAVGSRALEAAGRGDLRPALIAAVVGLHFVPFAAVFRERMFLHLGVVVALLGAAGLLVGALGVARAADAAAVVAGVVLVGFVAAYALGRYAPADRGRLRATPPA